jgi:hypothetical protein
MPDGWSDRLCNTSPVKICETSPTPWRDAELPAVGADNARAFLSAMLQRVEAILVNSAAFGAENAEDTATMFWSVA